MTKIKRIKIYCRITVNATGFIRTLYNSFNNKFRENPIFIKFVYVLILFCLEEITI